MKKYADTVEIDYHGNLILGINTKAKKKVMIAGHCDQIGLIVQHVTKEGFIYFGAIGGIDPGVLPGSIVEIHASKGIIKGVVGRKPIHLQKAEERKAMSLDMHKMWIDIGAKSDKEVLKKIEIGDPVTFKLGVTELGDDLICAPGLDDRVGLFVAMEAMKLCAKGKLNYALYCVSTVQEEIGLRGAVTSAYSVNPDIGIAVDVTFANDNPGKSGLHEAPCKLGDGPAITRGANANPIVYRRMVSTAKKSKIPYQIAPAGRALGNDANAMQLSRSGVATASIGLPNRYMHSQVEVCSLKDLENSAKLLAKFVKGLTLGVNLKPGN
ncbi:UNVERIFIED_CONTAM: hypothetical protein GTU68_029890 [Idotea baltica]|nr:hypothetical protein [Idotea baltica]